MARIDVAMAVPTGEVLVDATVTARVGDQIVVAFNSGPNTGVGTVDIGMSGGSGLVARLYADEALTQPLAGRANLPSGSTGYAASNFAVGMDWHGRTRVEVNTPLWCAFEVLSADQPDQPATYGVTLRLPPAPKHDQTTPPHRGGHHG